MRATSIPSALFGGVLWSSVGCGGATTSGSQARSPSLDYPPPAQETSQGEVVGADRIPPDDKLKSGARVGPGGASPSERPATSEPGRAPPQKAPKR